MSIVWCVKSSFWMVVSPKFENGLLTHDLLISGTGARVLLPSRDVCEYIVILISGTGARVLLPSRDVCEYIVFWFQELVPEFFFLPEMFVNTLSFDFRSWCQSSSSFQRCLWIHCLLISGLVPEFFFFQRCLWYIVFWFQELVPEFFLPEMFVNTLSFDFRNWCQSSSFLQRCLWIHCLWFQELVPEFFLLPEMFVNTLSFDFRTGARVLLPSRDVCEYIVFWFQELVPEFFFLPEMFVNTLSSDFRNWCQSSSSFQRCLWIHCLLISGTGARVLLPARDVCESEQIQIIFWLQELVPEFFFLPEMFVNTLSSDYRNWCQSSSSFQRCLWIHCLLISGTGARVLLPSRDVCEYIVFWFQELVPEFFFLPEMFVNTLSFWFQELVPEFFFLPEMFVNTLSSDFRNWCQSSSSFQRCLWIHCLLISGTGARVLLPSRDVCEYIVFWFQELVPGVLLPSRDVCEYIVFLISGTGARVLLPARDVCEYIVFWFQGTGARVLLPARDVCESEQICIYLLVSGTGTRVLLPARDVCESEQIQIRQTRGRRQKSTM